MRGTQETWFLGSDMMKPVFERLLPMVTIERMKRLSTLHYLPPKGLEQLPKRSAVVAFSASELYSLADVLRRLRGGVAVVFGGLSPTARNAQVKLFESGEVDYLVSTDAIGMGLNLNIKALFFDSLRKFDGKQHRPLEGWELGQIAGRSGRYTTDGYFGLTRSASEGWGLSNELITAIACQEFHPVFKVRYRNSDLCLESIEELKDSLQVKPFSAALVPALLMDDERALHALSQVQDFMALQPDEVSLLWDVCRIPDYQQVSDIKHQRFLMSVFRQLRTGFLNPQWVHKSISRLRNNNGDIDVLMSRIAHTRTWAYITHRDQWIESAETYKNELRVIEERLSDALHRKLEQRFIDYRSAKTRTFIEPQNIQVEGWVLSCSHGVIGVCRDFSFHVSALCNRLFGWKKGMALGREYFAKILGKQIEQGEYHIRGCALYLGEHRVLTLHKGKKILEPKLKPSAMELLSGSQRQEIIGAATKWFNEQKQDYDQALSVKRFGYLIQQFLGVFPIGELSKKERYRWKTLKKKGIERSQNTVYYRNFLRPRYLPFRLAVYLAWYKEKGDFIIPKKVCVPTYLPEEVSNALGWMVVGEVAIRIDILARIERLLKAHPKHTAVPRQAMQWLGCTYAQWESIILKLGYRIHEGKLLFPKRRK